MQSVESYSVDTQFFVKKSLTNTDRVLEHCPEVETDCCLLIFRAFLSDRIPKATKDINVHFFMQRFTFRGELILDNSLAVKNSRKLYQRIPRTSWSYLYEIAWEMRVISLYPKAPSPWRAQYAREHFVLRIVTLCFLSENAFPATCHVSVLELTRVTSLSKHLPSIPPNQKNNFAPFTSVNSNNLCEEYVKLPRIIQGLYLWWGHTDCRTTKLL